jgi:TonB family protein
MRNPKSPPGTLLELPLIEERYGWAAIASAAVHVLLVVFFIGVRILMPEPAIIQIGTGPGGGAGGESYTVGVSDDLGGGAGLFKAPTTPQPPAPPVEKPAKKEVKKEDVNAVALPDTASKTKKKAGEPAAKATKSAPVSSSHQIPDADAKGAGGTGGAARGAGRGAGDGIGISIGSGSGGIGDNYYARAVEARVGSNWSKPIGREQRIEIVYSFVVNPDGTITNPTLVKSSGDDSLDRTALRAILASNPLSVPPIELRGRPLLFMAQFVYPPDKD